MNLNFFDIFRNIGRICSFQPFDYSVGFFSAFCIFGNVVFVQKIGLKNKWTEWLIGPKNTNCPKNILTNFNQLKKIKYFIN
jgi:hypothetical protein